MDRLFFDVIIRKGKSLKQKSIRLWVAKCIIFLFYFGCFNFFTLAKPKLFFIEKADKILVIKHKRILMLLKNGEVLKKYKIALGHNPKGHKIKEGDNRTPEGLYFIKAKNKQSRFHLSLEISYPNSKDCQRADKIGVSPGGDIMIHGLPKGWSWLGKLYTLFNWTRGCIAVTNSQIEEIFAACDVGIPIEIQP